MNEQQKGHYLQILNDGRSVLCEEKSFSPMEHAVFLRKCPSNVQVKSYKVTQNCSFTRIVSEYDQEIPQSQTADNPVASRGRAAQPSQDTRKTN